LGKSISAVLSPTLKIHINTTLLLISIILAFSLSRTEKISIEMERFVVTWFFALSVTKISDILWLWALTQRSDRGSHAASYPGFLEGTQF
jgi:hypothetical protein